MWTFCQNIHTFFELHRYRFPACQGAWRLPSVRFRKQVLLVPRLHPEPGEAPQVETDMDRD